MPRLLFEKTGDSVWISHLDLMRVFQRAFRRAGYLLKHSQGFNPRAIVSIALPLSVGVESVCELLDFELDGEDAALTGMAERLNDTLPDGISVREAYCSDRKIKELTHLQVQLLLEYDGGAASGAEEEIRALFAKDRLLLEKRSKRGAAEVDILPMVKTMCVSQRDENTLRIDAVICAQNPSLNPQLLAAAVETYCPAFRPDFVRCRRLEILDADGKPFR